MSDDNNLPPIVEPGVLAKLAESEIHQQVATAHRFPRSLSKFRAEMQDMVTLDSATAAECMYSLPRDGKAIIGPSARFAEIVASAWGNSRCGARVVDMTGNFITAQGVFHDLERNVAITIEVQRRITDRSGRRFKDDMIGVTGNAAVSIALRNAVLKGVPKAFWAPMFDEVQRAIRGDIKTLADRRALALELLQKRYSVSAARVCDALEVAGVEDIGLDELLVLKGFLQSLKEGETTVDQLFPEGVRTGSASLNDKLKAHNASEDAADAASKEDAKGADPQSSTDDNGAQKQETASTRKPRQSRKPPTQTASDATLGDTSSVGNANAGQADGAQTQEDARKEEAGTDGGGESGEGDSFDFSNVE